MSLSLPCFLLVDDHALFRTGLALMLPQDWPEARVIQAASWGEAVLILQRDHPDLIMLDVHLPDGHGLADLATLQQHAPGTPVLLMSAEVDVAQLQLARAAGAAGFIPKSASASEVMGAVRSVLSGQTAFSAVPHPSATQRERALAGANRPSPVAQPSFTYSSVTETAMATALSAEETAPALSSRQLDILGYLGRGTPNKAIARRMGMNEADVRAEVSWLTEWLGASSREEAYAAAVARGLVAQ